ncbi:hypothetical protein WR25_22846 [Diploscapter pachys]|uniref:Uncharacterized protein n=1 Tax=Diploscapter pachys TaxID=2018661 RepID=A0A2A2LH19_9BILA|nr:hypothetical protein WR25_22846 [Diploscapter pachys]
MRSIFRSNMINNKSYLTTLTSGVRCFINYTLTRTYSVPDLSTYYSERYRPQWHTVWQTTPYRWRKDWDWYDDYWYNRHQMYYSPLYSMYFPKSRHYYRFSVIFDDLKEGVGPEI